MLGFFDCRFDEWYRGINDGIEEGWWELVEFVAFSDLFEPGDYFFLHAGRLAKLRSLE